MAWLLNRIYACCQLGADAGPVEHGAACYTYHAFNATSLLAMQTQPATPCHGEAQSDREPHSGRALHCPAAEAVTWPAHRYHV